MQQQVCWDEDYRFGFNGMEKDNEAKGHGNSYDFGARIYDSRLGRWLSLDPLIYKAPQWSPFAAMGDNPLYNIDIEGKYYVGTDDKPVKLKRSLWTGKLKIRGNNASDDLKELVSAVNASGSKTAIMQIMNAGRNETKIHVKVEMEVHEEPGQLGYGLLGLHQAHDENGKALNWDRAKGDFDGTPAYIEGKPGVYKEATITIFKGNIEERGGNGQFKGFDVTIQQEIANTFQHESNHDTDKEFIEDLKNKREGKPNEGIDPHKNITPQENKVYQEMHDHNKKKPK